MVAKLHRFGIKGQQSMNGFCLRPVISARRWAARPVGAANKSDLPMACHKETIVWVVNVLPHPGPPVRTSRREEAANSTALRCSSERVMPFF